MAVLANLARMSTATTGTGTITLGSAAGGCLSFADAGISDGQTVSYGIEDGDNSEVGRGVYTASGTTLTRSVLKSTNSGSAINLSGSAEVFIIAVAEDFPMALIDSASPTGTGTVTFSSIPQHYTHLQLVISGRGTQAATNVNVLLRFNNDSAGNYDWQIDQGSGATEAASEGVAQTSILAAGIAAASATAGLAGNSTLTVFNYTNTDLNTTVQWNGGVQIGTSSGNVFVTQGYGNWRNTAAVTRIDLVLSAGNWAAGSKISLYGLN